MDFYSLMHSGAIYDPGADDIMEEQLQCLDRLYDFNATRPTELQKRTELLKEMFAEIGEDCYIEPPFYANWGGKHVHFGNSVYANFHLTLVDDTHIYVGDHTMFGPNVTVATGPLPRQDIRFCRRFARKLISLICLCTSAKTVGSVRAR